VEQATEKLEKLKILLVEDHDAHAVTMIAMLRAFGIRRIDRADDAEAAVRLLRAGTLYDVMLCDFNLGSINGLSLVKVVRQNDKLTNRYMPIVMVTGDAKPDRIVAAREAGVNNFLSKPVEPPILLRTIQAILNNPRAFVETKTYFGPDRRSRQAPNMQGRRSDDRDPGHRGDDSSDPWM